MAGGTASIGPSIPLMDDDSRGILNETTPAEQRLRRKDTPLSAGPNKQEDGTYKPAKYKVRKKIKNSDGKPEVFEMTVEDR